MKYIFKKDPKRVIVYLILTIILALLMVSNSLVLKYIMDVASSKGLNKYVSLVINVLLFILVQSLAYYLQQLNSQYLAKEAVSVYRNVVFKRLSQQRLIKLNSNESGQYISLLTSQMDNLGQNYFYTFFWGLYLLIQFFAASLLSWIINPVMAVFAIILSIPNILIPIIFRKKLQLKKSNTIAATNNYVNKTNDLFSGLTDWKVNRSETAVVTEENKINEKLLHSEKEELKTENTVTVLNKTFSDFLYFGTWLIGTFFIMKNNLSIGQIVAFTQLVTNISFPIYSFSDLFSQWIGGKKVFDSIEKETGEEANTFENDKVIAPFSSIELKDVSVSFKEKNIIDSLSLKITAGQKYLIVGKSGSGKSTFIKLITKQLDDYQGEILLNGINITQLTDNQIYQNISYLPQDGHVFATTLRNNLTLYKNYPDETIIKVLKFVELTKWANAESLNMNLGNSDTKVSGGEAKRIELARLILREKSVLILDEFSSGIDKITLQKIESKLLSLPVTLLYVTHTYDDDLIAKADEAIRF
ncbi:ATP-binding cassette domain-containing protein [Lactobacillus melliventris]|uniref:ABC transporter ATP-binding protein n=1 Tax=Lactobacillus melliventris TaxID=1218507 RepID=A0ABX5N6L6_9LACO|nr:ABC transporter ATP-binding protein [Lactobacillus melliventris]PXY86103.1 ABC transporter ATP-binding protein [Lactobacillus melliventris]